MTTVRKIQRNKITGDPTHRFCVVCDAPFIPKSANAARCHICIKYGRKPKK